MFAEYIREIGRGAGGAKDLSCIEAEKVYASVLEDLVPDLELGALLLALRMKGESSGEMTGFLRAAEANLHSLSYSGTGVRPVVLPTYNGARKEANLTPLLALLLQRLQVPVLLHGLLEDFGRVTSAHVLYELGIPPVYELPLAQRTLSQGGMAFVPLAVLSSGLARQLGLRARLGLRNCAHSLVKMLDPFQGDGVVMAVATHPAYLDLMREILLGKEQRALLFRATEGEPFANPRRCPRIELIGKGSVQVLFEGERDSIRQLPMLPETADAKATASWTRAVLAGNIPVPPALVWQLAGAVYGCGARDTFQEALDWVSAELRIERAEMAMSPGL